MGFVFYLYVKVRVCTYGCACFMCGGRCCCSGRFDPLFECLHGGPAIPTPPHPNPFPPHCRPCQTPASWPGHRAVWAPPHPFPTTLQTLNTGSLGLGHRAVWPHPQSSPPPASPKPQPLPLLQTLNTGSLAWATALFGGYLYMVASWGGYSFIINLLPIHCLACVVFGRTSARLYVAYAPFVLLGALAASECGHGEGCPGLDLKSTLLCCWERWQRASA